MNLMRASQKWLPDLNVAGSIATRATPFVEPCLAYEALRFGQGKYNFPCAIE